MFPDHEIKLLRRLLAFKLLTGYPDIVKTTITDTDMSNQDINRRKNH